MNFKQAIQGASEGRITPLKVQAMFDGVSPLIKMPIITKKTNLWEWLAEYLYSGSETPESLAIEWDKASE